MRRNIIFLLVLLGCSAHENRTQDVPENTDVWLEPTFEAPTEPYEQGVVMEEIATSTTTSRFITHTNITYSDISLQDLPMEIIGAYVMASWGRLINITPSSTFLLTNVIENNVNVRILPSVDGRRISNLNTGDIVKIIGFYRECVNVNNFYGYWANIVHQRSDNEPVINGWVLSRYLNVDSRECTRIEFIEFASDSHGHGRQRGVRMSYMLRGEEVFVATAATDWNDYYIISWGRHNSHFHYTNRFGVYTTAVRFNI